VKYIEAHRFLVYDKKVFIKEKENSEFLLVKMYVTNDILFWCIEEKNEEKNLFFKGILFF
jgi:hypothetical protein